MQSVPMWQDQKTSPKAAAAVPMPMMPQRSAEPPRPHPGLALPFYMPSQQQQQQHFYAMQQFIPPTIYVTYHDGPASSLSGRCAASGPDPAPNLRFSSRYSPYGAAAPSPSPPRSSFTSKHGQNAIAKESPRYHLAPVEFAQPFPVTIDRDRAAENRLPPPPAPPLSTWKGNAKPVATEAWSEWWTRFKSDKERDGRPLPLPDSELPFSAAARQDESAAASLPSPAASSPSPPLLSADKKEMDGSEEEGKKVEEDPSKEERIRAVLARAESQYAESPTVSDLIRQIRDILDA